MEAKKVSVGFEDGKFELGVDLNQDGDKLVELSLNLSEAVQEVIARGEKVEGAKVVDFELSGTEIVVKFDTDKDGEHLGEIRVSLTEALQEAGVLS